MPRLEVKGISELLTALEEWGKTPSQMRAAFTSLVLNVINPYAAQRFAQAGPGWAPLSELYADWKAIHFPGKPLLVRTEKLYKAMTGGVGMAFTVSETGVTIDPSRAVPYWKYHELGTGRMPARKMLNFDARFTTQASGYLSKYLQVRAQALGFRVAA